jgi:hypothetical protein
MRALLIGVAAAAALQLAGCGTHYFPNQNEQVISLKKGDLEAAGIAFITPSTVTGQEQEKQAVALTFAEILKRERPQLKVGTLAETLSAVNNAGLTDAYKRMYDDYRDTGLFEGSTLKRVSAATGARYLAQLKLQGFKQDTRSRFGLFGFRVIDTHIGDVRLFLQIWDASSGSIAWEGMQELRMSLDSYSDEPVMLRNLIERTATDLIAKLP